VALPHQQRNFILIPKIRDEEKNKVFGATFFQKGCFD